MKTPTIPAATALLLLLVGCGTTDPVSTTDASTTPLGTPQGQAPAADPRCEAVADYAFSLIEVSFLANDLNTILSVVDPSAAPSAEAMHDSASLVLAAADDADAAILGAVDAIDGDVAGILAAYHESVIAIARWFAVETLESTDFTDLSSRFESRYPEFEALTAAFGDIDPTALGEYLDDTCGTNFGLAYFLDSSVDVDTATKDDIQTLGREIATYYVDNVEPDPVITIVDEDFYLLDEDIGPASPGVRVTDQYYNDSTDWCVELNNPSGRMARFRYSASSGLDIGSC